MWQRPAEPSDPTLVRHHHCRLNSHFLSWCPCCSDSTVDCLTSCMEMPVYADDKMLWVCELNIARTKHEHPFSSTHKGICLHAFSCAIRNLLLTWCQTSCMYSSSAVDLTVEELPRAERAHARTCLITYKHDCVAVAVIGCVCPLDLRSELGGLAFVGQNAGHGLPL